jgi:hypothetical protein
MAKDRSIVILDGGAGCRERIFYTTTKAPGLFARFTTHSARRHGFKATLANTKIDRNCSGMSSW